MSNKNQGNLSYLQIIGLIISVIAILMFVESVIDGKISSLSFLLIFLLTTIGVLMVTLGTDNT
jgi:hypothetical protein